jgi:putative spermidine/putrescine transport system permease protein
MGVERAATIVVWTVTVLVVLTLVAPLVVTFAVSISTSAVFNLPPPTLSTRWYERMLRLCELWPSVRLSVEIAVLSTAIALGLGTFVRDSRSRTERSRGRPRWWRSWSHR